MKLNKKIIGMAIVLVSMLFSMAFASTSRFLGWYEDSPYLNGTYLGTVSLSVSGETIPSGDTYEGMDLESGVQIIVNVEMASHWRSSILTLIYDDGMGSRRNGSWGIYSK